MGTFRIRPVATGFRFTLETDNGRAIASGEVYKTLAGCTKGAGSVSRCAARANLSDLTVDDIPVVPNPRFEIYRDKAGSCRFRLRARNGEIIATGDAFSDKRACAAEIELIRAEAPDSDVVQDEN